MGYTFTSDKCDFQLVANFAPNSFTISGDADNRIHLTTQMPSIRTVATSAKCDWSVTTVEPRFQGAINGSATSWLVSASSLGLSGELGSLQIGTTTTTKCDWYVVANASDPDLTFSVQSHKCDGGGSSKCDWHMTAGGTNLALTVDSDKCDWHVRSASDIYSADANNFAPAVTNTVISTPGADITVTSNGTNWHVNENPHSGT
jgi:hypothetical protein